MIRTFCFAIIILNLLHYSSSLQSGFTCQTSVTLTCPESTKILILEVIYSSECPNTKEESNGGAIYSPSACIGYSRDETSLQCNGKQTCVIDNNLDKRPSFSTGDKANCQFKGQSINVEYSCIPEFYSSKLPRIDICSLQSLHGVNEGFLHTPNYPNGYPNGRTCSKTVPSPPPAHRLKIYVLDFDIEGLSVLRLLGIKRINDWFQINNSGQKMFGTRSPYTLLFDDIIEASLLFKSDFANSKRSYNGFLLYFVVVPVRGPRPSTTSTISSTTNLLQKNENRSVFLPESKTAALSTNDRQSNNVGLTLLVVVLSGILFIIACGFLLYKRRNDRRIRYLTETFNSFFPSRSNPVKLQTRENTDESILNNTIQSKLDSTLIHNDEKYVKTDDFNEKYFPTPISKHKNINEKRENQEKQIFIENLKTAPSPYSSRRVQENKFNPKEQIEIPANSNSNIYSDDPLTRREDKNSLIYESVDDHSQSNEEVVYDVINTTNERILPDDRDDETVMYASPRIDV